MTTDMSASSDAPSQSQTITPAQVEFSGKGSEYFGIWIVNILLSIITLGIYSAWAKVRTNQYFYGHTRIDGHSLRYLATPMQILRGRILAAALFILYTLLTSFLPTISLAFTLIVMLVAPFLIVRSLHFNLRMTSYRNVRFGFDGTYGAAFLHFVVLPICAIFTLGIAAPWVLKKIDQFINGNVRYGDRAFSVETRAGTYYIAVLVALAVGVVGLIIWLAFNFSLMNTIFATGEEQLTPPSSLILMQVLLMLSTLVVYGLVGAVYGAIIRNHLYNHTSIENVGQMHSNVRVGPYCWLLVSNTLLTIITIGLAYPLTKVRKTAFLAGATQISIEPSIDSVIETLESENSAFGEEAAGFFDVDVSLG